MTDAEHVIPSPGSYKPGAVQVRLAARRGEDAALALLGGLLGEAWQPSTRKRGGHAGGDQLQYGTLIVPVPRKGRS